MALSAAMVWEVRPGAGASTGAGGFKAGATGTDYSQQNAAQRSWLPAGGTYTNNLAAAGATPTVLTSAAYTFIAADVGNVINITAGTNFTTGRYEIISVAVGAATLDRTCVAAGDASAGSGYEGGAVASLANIGATGTGLVAGNTIYVQSGTDTLAANLTLVSGAIATGITIEGYQTTRGDLVAQLWAASHAATGKLTLTGYPVVSTGANLLAFGSFTEVRCLSLTTAHLGVGIQFGGTNCTYKVSCNSTDAGGAASGVRLFSQHFALDCDFGTSGAASARSVYINTLGATVVLQACRITSLAGHGVTLATGTVLVLVDPVFYDIAAGKEAVNVAVTNTNVFVFNPTFNNCAACIGEVAGSTSAFLVVTNAHATNCTAFLTSATSMTFHGFFSRLRDNTANYTGFVNSAGIGDITGSQSDAQEYVDSAGKNFALQYDSLGRGAGIPPGADTGWLQRTEVAPRSMTILLNRGQAGQRRT